MDCDCLKLSTIFSFKGWEADNVILFIQKTESPEKDTSQPKLIYEAPANSINPEIIYTAITRARKNLFIFNFENEMYDKFFKK
jgi:ATP-dependent exoDNAse (exonuclease V) alpha subunit